MSLQVAICAGCNVFYPWAAAVVGLIAGLNYMLWSYIMIKCRIDDPLDAVAGERHDIDTPFILLALCARNPEVTSAFTS